MAEKILMLALSPTMETGQIVKWRKKEGDTIELGDVLCEVETDKAVMEYESVNEGKLLKIILPEGGGASVGEAIAIAGEEREDISDLLKELSKEKPPLTREKKIREPESVVPETEKYPGAKDVEVPGGVVGQTGRIKASPLARKTAEKWGLDLGAINGSGPGGRIIQRDVEKAREEAEKKPVSAAVQAIAPDISSIPSLRDETIPISGKRKVIARRLAQSKFNAPHYYLKLRVVMDDLLYARKNLNDSIEGRVSLNAIIIKLVAETLKRHPMVNSTWNGDTITIHGSIDIGLAVAIPDGLITPMVRNCGQKGIIAINRELRELIKKARNNRLKPEEFQGATFTISNLGSFGIEEFTAIINPPGSAILAIGAIQKEPLFVDKGEEDEILIVSMMKMTLSCDHRVIDGATGARFLRDLKNIMEDPVRAMY